MSSWNKARRTRSKKKKQEEVMEDRAKEDIDFDIEDVYFESSDED